MNFEITLVEVSWAGTRDLHQVYGCCVPCCWILRNLDKINFYYQTIQMLYSVVTVEVIAVDLIK